MIETTLAQLSELLQHPFGRPILLVLLVFPIAWVLTTAVTKYVKTPTHVMALKLYQFWVRSGSFIVWFLLTIALSEWLLKDIHQRGLAISQSLIAVAIAAQYLLTLVQGQKLARAVLYTIVPLLLLNAFDVLNDIVMVLEGYALTLGNVHVSLYDVIRVSYFGTILFWLGKESNRLGKKKIRQQSNIDTSTKELIAKLFEVGVYIVIFLLLLNILGINLTTLAVLGGAIGVGIGFGLQSIASNFVSGVIILLDRSLAIGDYIELADGRSGTITEVNLRAITLETFDGKDIVVPNDVFFSETFTNWTHKNRRQRYAIDYSVAYATDLDKLFPLVKEMLQAHPKGLSGDDYVFEEQPDIEIQSFGDNGIELHIEFWMEAIDDGEHRVGGDLLYSLWQLMKEHGFDFPFPQREVRVLKD
jgi:small-conductance mechanosensitive channel